MIDSIIFILVGILFIICFVVISCCNKMELFPGFGKSSRLHKEGRIVAGTVWVNPDVQTSGLGWL
jgi:hypothetical protein